TWQMVHNFLAGGAAINVLSRQAGIAVQVIDSGVNHDFAGEPAPRDCKIARGTANYVHGPAMSAAQCARAVETGAQLVRECATQGTNVIGFGDMGIGNTASASLLMHRVGGVPLAECVGRGTGLDDAGLARKRAILERAAARCSGPLAPLEALAEYGGFEIAMMAGAFLAAAEARMLIMVDGFIATSALLVASRVHPALLDYCVFAHVSGEAGHRRMLELLEARALLALEMRLGEGTGAAVCYPILQSAVAFLNEMASFADAGVSEKSDP
ncbi:MAG: nicotinate-nucleotide--dimethylbenzimidazole phosphoribosyltransferase, partial [Pseudomonadota bacterium]